MKREWAPEEILVEDIWFRTELSVPPEEEHIGWLPPLDGLAMNYMSGWEPKWEWAEEVPQWAEDCGWPLEEESKPIQHQDLFLGILSPSPSPLKEEPRSVAFVPLEPGTEQGAFVDTPPQAFHHQHHRHLHQEQQHFEEYAWMEQSYSLATSNGHALAAYVSPSANAQEPVPPQQPFANVQLTDISSCTPFYEPLSVSSSDCSWTGNQHSSEEFTSLSQDEIYEQIQRECAEIERRSASKSPPTEEAQPSTSRKTAKAPRRTRKPHPYVGRDSSSSVEEQRQPRAPQGRGRNKERKKELNRVAATRYRERKRIERELTEGELHELEQHNARLKAELAAVRAEMDYLRGLAKEIEAARRRH